MNRIEYAENNCSESVVWHDAYSYVYPRTIIDSYSKKNSCPCTSNMCVITETIIDHTFHTRDNIMSCTSSVFPTVQFLETCVSPYIQRFSQERLGLLQTGGVALKRSSNFVYKLCKERTQFGTLREKKFEAQKKLSTGTVEILFKRTTAALKSRCLCVTIIFLFAYRASFATCLFNF